MLLRLPFRILISIALVAFLAIEFAPGVILRAELDGWAHNAADDAAAALVNGGPDDARAAANHDIALHKDVSITSFTTDNRTVSVTVAADGKSYFAGVPALKAWFHVSASASQTQP